MPEDPGIKHLLTAYPAEALEVLAPDLLAVHAQLHHLQDEALASSLRTDQHGQIPKLNGGVLYRPQVFDVKQ